MTKDAEVLARNERGYQEGVAYSECRKDMNAANHNRYEFSSAPSGACGLCARSVPADISNLERSKMKTKITTIGRIAGLAVAVTLFTVAATAANAQEKGAAILLKLNAPNATAATIAPTYAPMSCANCKDTFVAVPDTDTKGAAARVLVTGGPPTRIIAKHACGNCGNEWVVTGHGKAKVSLPVHKCAACG